MLKKFLNSIFSMKNDGIHKVVTFLGLKFKIKSVYLLYKKLEMDFLALKQNNEDNKKRIDILEKELALFYEWRQNFYKSVPDKFPVRLSEVEIISLGNYINNSRNYLEFGAGGSTFIAANSALSKIYSVESDKNWLDYLLSYKLILDAKLSGKLEVFPVNIGTIKSWGYPINDDLKENYPAYSSEIFNTINSKEIDLVFIDGRFRVACALKAILNCSKDTKIIIHDYTFRETYHLLEEFLEVVEVVDTLAVLKIRADVDFDKVNLLYEEYKYIKE